MVQPTCDAETRGKRDAALQAFADARGRSALFLFLKEPMDLTHALRVQEALTGAALDEVDLVIHSGGGSIHAAFQILQVLRLHAKRINACVPFFAKSAATLLCIGADAIILDELAQLGPLDTQVLQKSPDGDREFTSALNPFKALEQLQKFAVETLDIAVRMISDRSQRSLDDSLDRAIQFVGVTTGPLFAQLDPEKLGEYSRALSVGTEYGDRLLRRYKAWDEEKRTRVLEQLVHGYPSHDYIIDYQELREIGFGAELFGDAERAAVQGLLPYMAGESVVAFVAPSPPAAEKETAA